MPGINHEMQKENLATAQEQAEQERTPSPPSPEMPPTPKTPPTPEYQQRAFQFSEYLDHPHPKQTKTRPIRGNPRTTAKALKNKERDLEKHQRQVKAWHGSRYTGEIEKEEVRGLDRTLVGMLEMRPMEVVITWWRVGQRLWEKWFVARWT